MRLAAAVAYGRWRCACDEIARDNARKPEAERRVRPYGHETESGCDADAPAPRGYWDGRPLLRCPARLVPSWAWDVLALYGPWTRGNLPETGGVLDQVAPVIEAMRVIEAAVHEMQEEDREHQESASGGSRGGETVIQARAPVRASIRK